MSLIPEKRQAELATEIQALASDALAQLDPTVTVSWFRAELTDVIRELSEFIDDQLNITVKDIEKGLKLVRNRIPEIADINLSNCVFKLELPIGHDARDFDNSKAFNAHITVNEGSSNPSTYSVRFIDMQELARIGGKTTHSTDHFGVSKYSGTKPFNFESPSHSSNDWQDLKPKQDEFRRAIGIAVSFLTPVLIENGPRQLTSVLMCYDEQTSFPSQETPKP